MADPEPQYFVNGAVESVRDWILSIERGGTRVEDQGFDPWLVLTRVVAALGEYAKLVEQEQDGRPPRVADWDAALRRIAVEAVSGMAPLARESAMPPEELS